MSTPAAADVAVVAAVVAPRMIVAHRSTSDVKSSLRPWAMHVFQGRANDEDEKIWQTQQDDDKMKKTSAGDAHSTPSSAVVPPPAHATLDLRSLTASQSASYANEYGKSPQQFEMRDAFSSLYYMPSDASAGDDATSVCHSITFHQVGLRNVSGIVRDLQLQQRDFDRRFVSESALGDVHRASMVPTIVVMNLCDGSEDDNYPGVTVARALYDTTLKKKSSEELPALSHTGADPHFFGTTTSKLVMKSCFASMSPVVRTSCFVDVSSIDTTIDVSASSIAAGGSHHALCLLLAPSPSLVYPLFIKPTSSYSSCGLSLASVVHSPFEALLQSQAIKRSLGNVLAEEFVQGREFSMLIVGDTNRSDADGEHKDDELHCYTACQRCFSASLPPSASFLTFEQNYPTDCTELSTWWGGLSPSSSAQDALDQSTMSRVAKAAYRACGGRSYGRVDMRQSDASGEFYVLEVNSMPGLSGHKTDSSIGAILAHNQVATSFAELIYNIAYLAVEGKRVQ